MPKKATGRKPPRRPPRAKAKARALRTWRPGASVPAPRAYNVFDPRCADPVPVLQKEGDALPVAGLVRISFTGSTAARFFYVIGNTGQSATCICEINQAAGGPILTATSVPALNILPAAGGPTSGRSMKVGFQMVNTSPVLNAGSSVLVLPARQRLALPAAPSAMVVADWTTVRNAIAAHPETRAYNGADFLKPQSFYSHPVDLPAYYNYQTWEAGTSADTFLSHAATWPTIADTGPRPMMFFWVVIELQVTANPYTISVFPTYATRWPLSTVPSLVSSELPTTTASKINAEQELAQREGSDATAVNMSTTYPVGIGSVMSAAGAVGMGAYIAHQMQPRRRRVWRAGAAQQPLFGRGDLRR